MLSPLGGYTVTSLAVTTDVQISVGDPALNSLDVNPEEG
jgi:hypothetical protein